MQQAGDNSTLRPQTLTLPAVIVAIVLSCVIVLLVEYHDGHVAGRNVVSQNYAAPVVLGVVFLFLCMNALLRCIKVPSLSGRELAVVLGLLVLTAPVMRYYAHNWVGTVGHTQALIYTESSAVKDLKKVNPYQVLPEGAMLDNEHSLEFLGTIKPEPGHAAEVRSLWFRSLSYFAPALLIFLVVSVCLALVFYRQWAHRELAAFPIAEFGAMLVESKQDRALPDIFYNRIFWAGVAIMIFIFGVNGIHAHSEKMIEVPSKFAYYDLAKSFPFLNKSREGYSLLRGTFYFTMIAVAVLLPSEISFTSWVTWPMMVVSTFFYYQQTGQALNGQQNGMILTGGHVAMAMLILYAGRTFYVSLLKRTVGLRARENVDSQSLWAMRALMASTFLLALVMIYRHQLPADVVLFWLVLGFVHLTVLCRLVAEMGIIWLPLADQAPLSVMLVMTGVKTMGVKAYAMLAILQSHLLPSHVSMLPIAPAVMNGARIEDRVTGRTTVAATALPALLCVLLVSAGVLIHFGYGIEGEHEDIFAPDGIPEVRTAATRIYSLATDGNAKALFEAKPQSLAERWGGAQLASGFTGFFFFGFALVMATGVARLKFPRFPLHPLPLLLLGTWLMSRYVFSFFVGWLIKKALVKIGGGRLFEQSRPFFAGIVVGQAVVATIWVCVNITIFLTNHHSFNDKWYRFMMDIYSS